MKSYEVKVVHHDLQERTLHVKSDSVVDCFKQVINQCTNVKNCSIISSMEEIFTADDGHTTT